MSLTTTRPFHILLVDDDPLVVKVYSERMRHEGWTVTVAHDGYDANLECRRARFDVILLDIRMPMQNGVEVLKEIRRAGANQKSPVYILTSLTESDDVDDALRLGAEGVFHKAEIRPDDLVKRVSVLLYGKQLVPRDKVASPSETGSWLVDESELGPGGEAAPPDEAVEPAPKPAAEGPREEEVPRPRVVPIAMDPLTPPPSITRFRRQFDVYVNPFLGDGAELLRSIGLREPFNCRECGGQPCLRLTPATERKGAEMTAAFFCSRCKIPI